MDTIRILLTKGRPSPKIRALLLTLLSSACRIGECLNLKWQDVDLKADPATLNIREEYTKTNSARVAYISSEGKEALLSLGPHSKEDPVSDYSGPMTQRMKVVEKTFRHLVTRTGLDRKLEGHRMHAIHIHLFRKYYYTKAVDLLGEILAHAMLGHKTYLDTYFLKTEAERKADYKRLEPALTTSAPQPVMGEDDVREIVMATLGAVVTGADETLLAAGVDPDIVKTVREVVALGNEPKSGPKQRVVKADELSEALAEGWVVRLQLQDGRLVLERPQ